MKNKEIEEMQSDEVSFEKVVDEKKREFMKKYGKFAASAPVMGFLLMTPGTSKAQIISGTRKDDQAP